MPDNEEKNNEEYDIPDGVILPEDDSPDYPNWKKGIIAGVICGMILGVILAVTPLSSDASGKIAYGILGFFMGLLMAGGIVAFRPSKN